MSTLVERVLVKIASGQAVSDAGFFNNGRPTILHMPSVWDTAAVCFATSADGTNFYFQYDTLGVIITVAAAANNRIIIPDQLNFTKGLKIFSGLPSAPVNQTAERDIPRGLDMTKR